MKYNLFYLSGGGKKALLLVLSLFLQISLFAGWSLREKNNRTKFCCDEEYEFIFDASGECTCIDALNENMIDTKPASLIANSLTSLGNDIYSFKVKFDCESAKISGKVFSIEIKCQGENSSECQIKFETTSVRPKLNLQNIIQKIDCGKADAFKLKLPTGNYPPDLVTLEFAYSPGLSGPAAGNPNEDIYVTPETGTTTGTVTVTAKDIYCDQTSSATVAIERNPPPAPGIPRPSGQDPNCPSSIWCYYSQNGISIEIPQVPGAVDYEMTSFCFGVGSPLSLNKDPNNPNKYILTGQFSGNLTCDICVRAKNVCNIWSEEVCYSIVITTERPLAPQLILDDPNLAWWICCPTLEIPGGVFQVGSNSCSNLVEIIGNDGKIISSSNALRIGGAIGSEQANNGNIYSDNVCNPFVYTSFTVKITSSNCFGNTTSSYGFNTLPYGDSRCPNQQLKTGRGKSDIEIEVKEIDAENYLIKTNAGQGNTIHLYTMDGATLLESKNKELLVKKSLVKDKIILIQASDNEASSSKKYFFGN